MKSASGWNRLFSAGKLSVDIVDYPGEWLLDLPLLGKSYAEFSRDAFELAALPVRSNLRRTGGIWPRRSIRRPTPTR